MLFIILLLHPSQLNTKLGKPYFPQPQPQNQKRLNHYFTKELSKYTKENMQAERFGSHF